MSDLDNAIETTIADIMQAERERAVIYEDEQVTEAEHPRLAELKHEIERLWDLRRRLEAAKAAGLTQVPVMPSVDPTAMTG